MLSVKPPFHPKGGWWVPSLSADISHMLQREYCRHCPAADPVRLNLADTKHTDCSCQSKGDLPLLHICILHTSPIPLMQSAW
ncbi:hypothetical protein FKM82_018404 [Ascaphus truei]